MAAPAPMTARLSLPSSELSFKGTLLRSTVMAVALQVIEELLHLYAQGPQDQMEGAEVLGAQLLNIPTH